MPATWRTTYVRHRRQTAVAHSSCILFDSELYLASSDFYVARMCLIRPESNLNHDFKYIHSPQSSREGILLIFILDMQASHSLIDLKVGKRRAWLCAGRLACSPLSCALLALHNTHSEMSTSGNSNVQEATASPSRRCWYVIQLARMMTGWAKCFHYLSG